MKFFLYGESEALGCGAWCYAEALLQRGHEIVTFSPENLKVTRRPSFWDSSEGPPTEFCWPFFASGTEHLRGDFAGSVTLETSRQRGPSGPI